MLLANQLLLISYLIVCEIIFYFEFPDIPEKSWRGWWKKQANKCKAFCFSSKRKNWIHAWKPKTFSNKSFDQKVKKYAHFQTVTTNAFPGIISNNNNFFRELLANNTTHFSRVYINQYWHFQRVPSKLINSKNFVHSSYHTILILSESYYQTILTCSELKSNSIYTFVQLLSNDSKHFFENLNGHLNRKKILKQKIPKQKGEKLA